MAFRVRGFVEVVRGMIAHMRAAQSAVTDFSVGGIARTMLEAPAAEIDRLYQAYAQGLVEGIPTAIYRAFDFPLRPAVAASGMVRLTSTPLSTDPVVLSAGFLVASTSGARYSTATPVTVPAGGGDAEVLVVAQPAGAAGNAPAGGISVLVSSGHAIASVTNPLALVNGREAETEDERKLRFVEFVRSLARGTVASNVYAVRLAQVLAPDGTVAERVARVSVDETLGHVEIRIHNGVGATSAELVNRAIELIEGHADPENGVFVPGYRPTGMRVDVLPMDEIAVNVSVQVRVPAGLRSVALGDRIAASISAAIRGVESGGNLLPLDVLNATLGVPGVTGATVTAPVELIPCPASAVLLPGTVEVSWR